MNELIETKTTKQTKGSVEVLRSIFVERKNKNAHYSMNAFARDLDLSPSLLSRILNGSRALTLKQGLHLSAILDFSQAETNQFILSIVEGATKNAKISKRIRDQIQKNGAQVETATHLQASSPLYTNFDVERFKTISRWYHLPILNLTFVKGFKNDPSWIARRLGITRAEAQEALERLLELGFLEETSDGAIKKTQANLFFKTERSEAAMRQFHQQMIEKAKLELNKTESADFDERLINSITFACAPEHLKLLKKKIDEFQDEVLALTKSGPHQEIYQLNCQLFPLTKKDTQGESK